MENKQKKSFMLDKGYFPLIECIMHKNGIETFEEFVTMAVEEFILTRNQQLPKDIQQIPNILKNERVRLLIDKEIEGLNHEVGFIEDIKIKLTFFNKCNAQIEYYQSFYLSCKKKLLTFQNKKKLLISMNKVFKDHLENIIKLNIDTNETRNPIKNINILKFIKNNILQDETEFNEFICGIKKEVVMLQ